MKIIKFLKDNKEKIGLFEDNQITELSCSTIDAINSQNFDNFKKYNIYSIEDIKIKPPVSPSKIVCIGLNYKDHAAELNMELLEEPTIFLNLQHQ